MSQVAIIHKESRDIIISRAIPIHGVLVVVNVIYYPKRKW
jgi:hypothetical protein